MQLVCNLYGYFIGDQCCDARIFNYSDIRIYRRSNWIIGTYCSGYFPINSVHSLFDYALEVPGGAVKRSCLLKADKGIYQTAVCN